MTIRASLAQGVTRLLGYRFTMEEEPPKDGGVFLGAPHTSNWDLGIMYLIAWQAGIPVRWLGKSQIFRPPFGAIPRLLGGIPVDRDAPQGMAHQLAEDLRKTPGAVLIIAPEGTRKKRDHWKSGFYRIARDAALPIVPGFVDTSTKTIGLGPTVRVSEDISADMDQLRAFYRGKSGVRPGLESRVYLRMEEEAVPASSR